VDNYKRRKESSRSQSQKLELEEPGFGRRTVLLLWLTVLSQWLLIQEKSLVLSGINQMSM
jgi:hypothetical protein